MTVTLGQASALVDAALARGGELGLAPLTVAVLDPGGHLVVLNRQDGSGILRADIAVAKAWGVRRTGQFGHRSARFAGYVSDCR